MELLFALEIDCCFRLLCDSLLGLFWVVVLAGFFWKSTTFSRKSLNCPSGLSMTCSITYLVLKVEGDLRRRAGGAERIERVYVCVCVCLREKEREGVSLADRKRR